MSPRNISASVRARLLAKARTERQDYNRILTRYALERLLYRVSVSPHADQFLLKGALLFDLWFGLVPRPTRDADLYENGSWNTVQSPTTEQKQQAKTQAQQAGAQARPQTSTSAWSGQTASQVRFFGGYDFTKADASRTPAAVGYAKGVPMGADLPAAQAGKAPTFLVAALKDPKSGNLDRIQIIKGWLDKSGTPQERIYDVIWGDADKRKIVNGKLTSVGTTVDVEHATWTNTIGDPELITVWKDPDFDPAVRAFYYVRVLEIPTPRWTAYDAAYFKVKMDANVPMVTQERAITSPIWYTPR